MKTTTILSWNVNGIRAVLKKGFTDFLTKHEPDYLCLQETKAHKEQVEHDFTGYYEYWNSADRKGYAGTAIFSKQEADTVIADIREDEQVLSIEDQYGDPNKEGRVITTEFDNWHIVSVYTPNSKRDLSRIPLRYNQWDPAFLEYIKNLETKKPVIYCGDFNVAHTEIDLARPKDNDGKHGFTKEEREGFDHMLEAGFIDTFRKLYPNKTEQYTWWTHWGGARARNVGWRIDYVMISPQLEDRLVDAFILPEVMGSDHCPVGVTLRV